MTSEPVTRESLKEFCRKCCQEPVEEDFYVIGGKKIDLVRVMAANHIRVFIEYLDQLDMKEMKMAKCKQCGIHIMIPPDDQICPICGCEDMFEAMNKEEWELHDKILREEINKEIVRSVGNKCIVCGEPATWKDPNSLNKLQWTYCDKHKGVK